MLVDFHSHTFESDGTLSPAELSAAMKRRGVQVFSITDHDALAAYDALQPGSAGDPAPASLVTGIEINTTYRANEVHVLGYGFDRHDAALRGLIERNARARGERAQMMVDQLKGAGVALTLDAVRAEAPNGAPLGRPHVAKALVRAGLVSDVESAFRNLLSRGKPGYVPSHYVQPHEAVATIAGAGGVAVLAHPCRLRDEALIDELVEAGIAGLEVFYPAHSPSQVAHYREIAARFGLAMTAGSDFHDPRWNVGGVGVEVERADVAPFLEIVGVPLPAPG